MLNIFAVIRSHFQYRRNFSILALIFIISIIFSACSSDSSGSGDIDKSSWTFTVFNFSISNTDFDSAFGTPPTPGPEFPRNLVFGTKSRNEMLTYLNSNHSDRKYADQPYENINAALENAVDVYINSTQKQQILDKLASDEYVVVGIDQEIDEGPGKVGVLAFFKQ